jgi:peptide/nickel transport system permease protein
LIVEVTFSFAAVILSEAGLSFLGLGIIEPMPSLGGMIRDGALYLLIAPHYIIVTGLALMSLVITLNLLGDKLRDYWDSKSV